MNDSSSIRDVLIFTVYKELGSNKSVLFTTVLITYVLSLVINVSLLLLFYLDHSLHKPMYIFLFCLLLNGLIGSTAVWPRVMFLLWTDINSTSYKLCLVQVFLNGTYGGCNFTILTVMAYDRFVSIFRPLQYHTVMTPLRVKLLLVVANLPAALVLGQVILTIQIPLCKYNLHRLFCDNLSVSNLSCGETFLARLSNLYGLCAIIIFVVFPICLIFLSYVKIMKLSLKASRHARRKAIETCSPHIMVFINFSLASLFSVIYNRRNPYLPGEAHILMAIIYILLPPLLHPIIYGIKSQEIRCSIFKIWKRRKWFI
ncbi:hypothetical protein ACEWY4_008164 [Coilia grayii]|uniref:Olfactory receptor n=1 Tax=Coilia grayii TaxID=363190 RepID=A0ABD1KAF9_9TELE